MRLYFYFKALRVLEKEVVKRNCKTAILVDFQTFNLSLAKRLSKRGVKVLYYVAPQAWAWKSYRAKIISNYVHTLFTILPFEKKWFEQRGASKIISVSHPIKQKYQNILTFKKDNISLKRELLNLLLLPGSRNEEVQRVIPDFISVVKKLKKLKNIYVTMVVSDSVKKESYRDSFLVADQIVSSKEIHKAFKGADLALAVSGTVTLELALWQIPTIVVYKLSLFTSLILEQIVAYKGYISLANIIHNEEIFPSFIRIEQVHII